MYKVFVTKLLTIIVLTNVYRIGYIPFVHGWGNIHMFPGLLI